MNKIIYDYLAEHRELDAVILSSPENMRFVTGYTGEGFFVIGRDFCAIVTDSRYTVQAGLQSPDMLCLTISKGINHFDLVGRLFDEHSVKKAAFEDLVLTVSEYNKAVKAVKAELVAGDDAFNLLRMSKSAEELEKIRRACKIADDAFDDMLHTYKRGMTEKEAAWLLEKAMRERGGEGLSFDTIVAAGENGAMPHAIPTDRQFRDGDLVVMDFGTIYDGYHSDMTRTIAFGEVSDKCHEIYNITLEAQRLGVRTLKAELTGNYVDSVVRDYIANAGYGDKFGHSTGHGVGLLIHELPNLTYTEAGKRVLKPGHVVSVEPGIYLEGTAGVRIEDLCAVTEAGCDVLTSSPKELIKL